MTHVHSPVTKMMQITLGALVLLAAASAQPPPTQRAPVGGLPTGQAQPRVEVVRVPLVSPTARIEAERIFHSLCHDYSLLLTFARSNPPAQRSLPNFEALQKACPILERPSALQKYTCANAKVPDLSSSGECADTTTEAVMHLISMCSAVKEACSGPDWKYTAVLAK